MFEKQTIGELRECLAESSPLNKAEQGLVEGPIPLSPIEHWFFDQDLPKPHHFNQSMLLEVKRPLEPVLLERAMEEILKHHDALRLRFERKDAVWCQWNIDHEDVKKVFSAIDLSTSSKEDQKTSIETLSAKTQASFDLKEGPLIKVVLFHLSPPGHDRLLIVIHHLAIDGVSWRILLEDIEKAYEALLANRPIQLPPKTTSFKEWSSSLREYAQSEVLKKEEVFWLGSSYNQPSRLPLDHPEGENTNDSLAVTSVTLGPEETQALLQEVPKSYHTQINDILVTALLQTFSKWTGQYHLLFELEGHGREDIKGDINISRTVGWFTSIFPVSLALPKTLSLGDVIKSIKEDLRKIPQKGIGYGIFRYLSEDKSIQDRFHALPQPQIRFNYLGQFNQTFSKEALFEPAQEKRGPAQSSQGKRSIVLDINSIIHQNELQIHFTYSKNLHQDSTIKQLAQDYLRSLKDLIAHCLLPDSFGYTPSDFPLVKDMNQQVLDKTLEKTGDIRNIEALHPLSPLQEGLLFESLLNPQSGVYVLLFSCALQGRLNLNAFTSAWDEMLKRHAVLRTSFVWQDVSQPFQIVFHAIPLSFKSFDWRASSPMEQQEKLAAFLETKRSQDFDFLRAPLMDITLIQTGEETHEFIWRYHHILLDGWSVQLVLKEFFSLYEALSQGKTLQLESRRSYRDYIQWLQAQDLSEAEKYWRENLKGFWAPTPLPLDKAPSFFFSKASNFKEEAARLSESLTQRLRSFIQRNHLTFNTVLQGVWALLLSRYSGEEDIVFGSVSSGRPGELPGVESMVGLFINTLPTRIRISPETPVLRWLQELQDQQVIMRRYEYTSLAKVKKWSDVPTQLPLFESLFQFQNYPSDQSYMEEGAQSSIRIEKKRSLEQNNFPITFFAALHRQLNLQVFYDARRFDTQSIDQFIKYFTILLENILETPHSLLRDLFVLSPEERFHILRDFNQTQTSYPNNKTIHELFQEQVAKTPDNTAVVFDDRSLTYRELNERSNQLAHYLREKGVVPDTLVGICVERSFEMIIGILGILKAGGAYLPLDSEYPLDRLQFMIEDSGTPLLLTQEPLLEKLPSTSNTQLIFLDNDWNVISQKSTENLSSLVLPHRLAYCIYTSGSTGKPKGAGVFQKGFLNLLQWFVRDFSFSANDRIILITSFSFDLTQKNIIAPLIAGGELHLLKSIYYDPSILCAEITSRQITNINCTPTMFYKLLEISEKDSFRNLASLRNVFLGGEPISLARIRPWINSSYYRANIINTYGPTECSDISNFFSISIPSSLSDRTVPIGKPISGVATYVLDSNMEPALIGSAGELFIGGQGVGFGYVSSPVLTAEKFVPDPFSAKEGERLYRTGDLARYLPDGNIELLGRIDHQVKVRGFRIEIGEIESVLKTHCLLQEVAVIAIEHPQEGDKYLAAYLVPRLQDSRPTMTDLRNYLKDRLPDYMIPSHFIFLDSLPLTPNGKLDRKALPEPDTSRPELGDEYVPPRTPEEEMLVDIWKEVLALDKVGIYDNFFDLGGHSLLATQVINRIQQAFSLDIPLKSLFESPTIAGFQDVLDKAKEEGKPPLTPITRAPRQDKYPLSFAQTRLWFLAQLEPDNPFYNIASALRLRGDLRLEVFEKALNTLINRHASFRTSFFEEEGVAYQKIEDSLNLTLSPLDLSSLPEDKREEEAKRLAQEDAQTSFDLTQAPLIRAKVLKLEDHDHVLLLNMHHIISDAWSSGIFWKELTTLYSAFSEGHDNPLSPPKFQYIDYALWQKKQLEGEILKTQESYWKNRFQGELPVLNLPTDRPRPPVMTYQGALETLSLSKDLTERLKDLSHKHNATLFMIILAAFNVFLSRYSGQEDIVIGSPIANRHYQDTEEIIGYFLNTLALRTDLSGDPTFLDLLRQVRERCLDAYKHQDYPFERLIEVLKPHRDMSRSPLFQVALTLQNAPSSNTSLRGLDHKAFQSEHQIAKFDLTTYVWERSDGGLMLAFEYYRDLFESSTIQRMMKYFKTLLEAIVQDSGQTISNYPLLYPEERHHILQNFNQTQVDYSSNKTIHSLFEEQVIKTPNSTAVVFEDRSLTYQELNERSNQLAHYLRKRGVVPDQLVGICVERSLEMIIGILGILKAGGAYLPLDSQHPKDRIRFMMEEDSKASLLLTQASLKDHLPENTKAHWILLDQDWDRIARESTQNPPNQTSSHHLAYCIYTSGSTGKPKGVEIYHQGLTNYFYGILTQASFHSDSTFATVSTLAADLGNTMIFASLCIGGCLHVISEERLSDPSRFSNYFERYSIDYLKIVPSHLSALLGGSSSNRILPNKLLILGGDVSDLDWVKSLRLQAPYCNIMNHYGPTESTVGVSTFRSCGGQPIHFSSTVPIGTPISNTQIYLLDPNFEPVPIGVPGELHIGGAGLARGYLNRPDLTAEKFIPNPFTGALGERLYRTGDLARYLPDGNIEFLGRIDHQVKIRGFRIELGEIEGRIKEHPLIRDVFIDIREKAVNSLEQASELLFKRAKRGVERLHTLHNDLPVYYLNANEADYLYEEIFVRRAYLKHGISLEKGACVFDIGANIGLFALFAAQECQNIRLYCFEPISQIFEILKENISAYQLQNISIFNLGISNIAQVAQFVFYPNMSLFSGLYANAANEENVMRAFMLSQAKNPEEESILSQYSAEILEGRLDQQKVQCQLKTLSEMIRETRVDHIDLLKINVEKSELDVLLGIEKDDWLKIRQIVLEVDTKENLFQIESILRDNGFEITAEQPPELLGTDLCYIYAINPKVKAVHRSQIPAVDQGIQSKSVEKSMVAYLTPKTQGAKPNTTDLRNYLKDKLPDYMIPAHFIFLDSLPLTPNGKLDRKALPGPDTTRPLLEKDYVPPRTPEERILVPIFQGVLKIDQIGIHDNFFELGGDSIKTIQIVSRAAQGGLRFTVKDMFEHQTIAELARLGNPQSLIKPDQGLVTGSAPLTPIQHWFFDQNLPEPHYFNQAMFLETRRFLDPCLFERVLEELILHHDALRLRFHLKGTSWNQGHVNSEDIHKVFSTQDLSDLSEVEQKEVIKGICQELQAGLKLGEGPLIRIALFHMGPLRPQRLFIVIHHLVIDTVSWRILLEDIETGYDQLLEGQAIQLPPKTVSFKEWSDRLTEYAQSEALTQEAGFWIQDLNRKALSIPRDYSEGENTNDSVSYISVSLTPEETEVLLKEVPKSYHTQINDILLTALSQAVSHWTHSFHVLFDLEGHGREEILEGIHPSRTVGWFTSLFPVSLTLPKTEALGETIKSIKEQLRQIPSKGIGYGIARYLSQDIDLTDRLKALPQAEIRFNYLGQFNEIFSEDSFFGTAKESQSPSQSSQGNRTHLIDINGRIQDGKFHLGFTYSRNIHQVATIQSLAQNYIELLKALIRHCQLPEAFGYTPSDFPLLKDVNQEVLDQVLERTGGDIRNIKTLYPLSSLQGGLFFESLLNSHSGVNIELFACTLRGGLDPRVFVCAWEEVMKRHAILRTSFVWNDVSQPLQIVFHSVPVPFESVDWRDFSPKEQKEKLSRLLETKRFQDFDFSKAPLMDINLIQTEEETHEFIWRHHHILLDGWSVQLILKEFFSLYEALSKGMTLRLEEPRPYEGYIKWLQSQDLLESEKYWKEALKGLKASTPLPMDRAPQLPFSRAHDFNEKTTYLTEFLTQRIRGFIQKNQLTFSTLLHGIWSLLLSRYSGEEDIVFGSVSSGRPGEISGVESMVGLFINTLPTRIRISLNTPLLSWLQEIQKQQVITRQYEYTPLSKTKEWSEVPSLSPLFESLFLFENYPIDSSFWEEQKEKDLKMVKGLVFEQTSYPLTVITASGKRLSLKIYYDKRRFYQESIHQLLNHFQIVLEAIVENPNVLLSEISLLSQEEKRHILSDFNDTQVDYPRNETLPKLFEEQVVKTPDNTAVVFEDQTLTYKELNERSNQLAHYLKKRGVIPDTLVGICVERSLEMIIGILGIFKAGGAYLPLDPQYPKDRIHFMLEDAKIPILLTHSSLAPSLPQDQKAETLFLDTHWPSISQESQENPLNLTHPHHLAYCIYTSGSTGKPKGISLEQASLINLLHWHSTVLPKNKRIVQFASMSFDASFHEIFAALLNGGDLWIPLTITKQDPSTLVKFLHNADITKAILPPVLLQRLADEYCNNQKIPMTMKDIISTGEHLQVTESIKKLFQEFRNLNLYNHYGPSETHVVTAYHFKGSPGDWSFDAPIGTPISNTQIHLLDPNLEPTPIGVPGELHIGGVGLARGYFNRPDLTAEKFIPNPFSDKAGERLYKTGDLARYLPDGNIEFLGRIDHQVKIRGFRIELGEIESSLRDHPNIQDTVVLAKEEKDTEGKETGTKYLVAYLIPKTEDQRPNTTDLRNYLKDKLPDYMIPAHFIFLDSLPLTPNGKLDRKALPETDASRPLLEHEYAPPRAPEEEILCQIFQEILKVEKVGIYDNFFDLGGHSLLATQVINRIRRVFSMDISLKSLFENPRIVALAEEVMIIQLEMMGEAKAIKIISEMEAMTDDDVIRLLSEKGKNKINAKRK